MVKENAVPHVVISSSDAAISEIGCPARQKQGTLPPGEAMTSLKVKAMLLHSLWFKEPPDNNLTTFADAIMCVE